MNRSRGLSLGSVTPGGAVVAPGIGLIAEGATCQRIIIVIGPWLVCLGHARAGAGCGLTLGDPR